MNANNRTIKIYYHANKAPFPTRVRIAIRTLLGLNWHMDVPVDWLRKEIDKA